MVLASAAKPFTPHAHLASDDDRAHKLSTAAAPMAEDTRWTTKGIETEDGSAVRDAAVTSNHLGQQQGAAYLEQDGDLEMARPPYAHAMLSGGLGGLMGDMLMHSLDTVKTRQQGDPHMPPKYTSMGSSYYTILRQEGVRRGLYGGVVPAFAGSFSGTVIFFGTYEWSKRWMLDLGITPSLAYLASGFVADLAASPLYVPSEVLKTRLQLQGRFDNPYFKSGYNYRSTLHAARSIVKYEGWPALFYGYKATLFRDLPFSALQFAFWEQELKIIKGWTGRRDPGLGWEILAGASAGGAAGIITCPLDVVKTRIQTQQNHGAPHAPATASLSSTHQTTSTSKHTSSPSATSHSSQSLSKRPISTSSPSTSLKRHSAITLDTSSVLKGLRLIYQTEGIPGWFRGVGPRAVWTSVQSGTMLVMYQVLLRWFERHPIIGDPEGG